MASARTRHDEARKLLANDIDPGLDKQIKNEARFYLPGHVFRSMASTILNEQGWNRDAIERQLAHAERNSIRAAYNYAEHLPERRKMMQHWADYLDQLQNQQ